MGGPKKSGRGRTVSIVAAVLFCAAFLAILAFSIAMDTAVDGIKLAGFRVAREPVLVITDGKGRKLETITLPDGRFSLVFVHSFHLTPVEERMELDGSGGFHLYELRYQSCGVGMPTEAEEGFALEDGEFILSMDRRFGKIPVMVSILSGHGILAGGKFHPFADWAAPGDALVLLARSKISIQNAERIDGIVKHESQIRR